MLSLHGVIPPRGLLSVAFPPPVAALYPARGSALLPRLLVLVLVLGYLDTPRPLGGRGGRVVEFLPSTTPGIAFENVTRVHPSVVLSFLLAGCRTETKRHSGTYE